MKKTTLYWTLTIVSIMTLNISNIISQKQLAMPFGLTCAAGIITIPIVYVANDCMTEVYGFRKAMQTTGITYATNLFASLCFIITINLPSSYTYNNNEQFAAILGNTPRFLLASAVSFIIGSAINNAIMTVMHNVNGENHLFIRCWLSTVAGEISDKTIYMLIAFVGTLPMQAIATNILTSTLTAIIYETIVYPLITRHVIKWAKTLD